MKVFFSFCIIINVEEEKMPKVKVNKDACGSCGLCVGSRPDVFEFDDEGKAQAVVAEVDGLDFECPFGAIDLD